MEPNAGYYLRLDNYTTDMLKENWLKNIVEVADKFPQIGIVGYNFERRNFPTIHMADKKFSVLSVIQGPCILIPKKINKSLGFWIEDEQTDAIKDYGQRASVGGCVLAYMEDTINPSSNIPDQEFINDNDIFYKNGMKPIYVDSNFIKTQKSLLDPLFDCSIIIPVYDKIEYTQKCIKAISSNSNIHINYEVIIVDNGSTDDTQNFLQRIGGNLQVITNTYNLGFAKACNMGAKAARGKYVLFLNNDTIPFPGWIEPLFRGIEQDGADIVGAKLIYPDGKIQHAGVAFNKDGIGFHLFRREPFDFPPANKKRFLQCVTGACLFMKKQTFFELEGFNEKYINGFEDVDFCLKASTAGKKILYNPECLVVHYEETSEGRKKYDFQNLELFFSYWKNKVEKDGRKIYLEEDINLIR
jgi:GT2 family glycosyltransferase